MINKSLRAYITSSQAVLGVLTHSEVLRLFLCQLLKHQIDRVLKLLIVLPDLHGVDKRHQRGEVLFLHRGLVMEIADQRGIQKRFGFGPELVSAFLPVGSVGNQGSYQLQNILFTVDIGERIVVVGLSEIDCIQNLDAVLVALQQFPSFQNDCAFW